MKEAIHKILSNTWAVVTLLGIGMICMVVLVVTDSITWNEGKAAVISIVSTATLVWLRGAPPPGATVLPPPPEVKLPEVKQ